MNKELILSAYLDVVDHDKNEATTEFEHGWNEGYLQGVKSTLDTLGIKIKGINE